jgi:hypothetical protein
MHGITRKLISLREHTEASAPPLEAMSSHMIHTWDGEIQKIQQAINTARHEITGH